LLARLWLALVRISGRTKWMRQDMMVRHKSRNGRWLATRECPRHSSATLVVQQMMWANDYVPQIELGGDLPPTLQRSNQAGQRLERHYESDVAHDNSS
jgi:hypothetical protein